MRLAVLFSGGKDSALALLKAMEKDQVVCLITLLSSNPESYMFHTANISLTKLQSKAIGLPLVTKTTQGIKESELTDLTAAVEQVIKEYNIEGIVTGAIQSAYQSERIQRICRNLGLSCINPLWKINQRELLLELLSRHFKIIISGVYAYPLDKSWLGKVIDRNLVEELLLLQSKYGLSSAGEGGEIETTVLDAPIFRKRVEVLEYQVQASGNSGVFVIMKAVLVPK